MFLSRRIVPSIPLQKRLQCGILAHLGHGIDVCRLKMLTNDAMAKHMQRADLRAARQQHLPAQMRVARRLRIQRGDQAFAQLRRRGTGEGDNQQAVDLPALAQQLQHMLHQHGCLAAACRCADQQLAVARVDGLPLRLRPLRHDDPPLDVSRETISYLYFTTMFHVKQ